MMARLMILMGLGLMACGPSAKTLEQNKKDARYHYDLAYGYYVKGHKGHLALREVTISLQMNEEDADAQQLAGLIYLGRKRYLTAIKHFKAALKIRPNFYFASNNLGVTYLSLERWDDAIKIFEALVENGLYTQVGHAYNNLGWARYKKGELREARVAFDQAMAASPDLCPPYNNQGLVLFERARYSSALKVLNRGIKRCPNYAEAYFQRGRVLLKLGQMSDARASFARCATLVDDTPLGDRCADRVRLLSQGSR